MSGLVLNPSARLRRSPLFEHVRAAGAKAFSVYNRTLIGQWYRSLEEDYDHLRSAVQVWDVGGERVVEIAGPDARALVQASTPRDLGRIAPGQCAYIPMVNRAGGMLNDPVLTCLGPERYWIALADSDAALYLEGVAAARGLDAALTDPDVWIVAIQGPRADDLAARVFGEGVRDIGFFRHAPVELHGATMPLARSGFSKQGGFELHVTGAAHAVPVWETLLEAGEDLDVRVGCPNLIERVEGGLLSYGNDMTAEHTPFEAGLGRFCHLDRATGCLGQPALEGLREPARQIRALEIAGGKVPVVAAPWRLTDPAGRGAGQVSSAAWSPGQGTNVAIAMVDRAHWAPGTVLRVDAPDGTREAVVREAFWA